MKPNQYKVIQTNPGAMLFEGQTITPYYEDDNEIIINVAGAAFDHHIRKSGELFKNHLQPIGGK
ncbi:hypothetical protein KP806_07400 [Paenibacillus sp. N4]|uniref:hypothetical protein n=1 Tax=Paenibacillus vietnamensis TaxID=2590547 RepID=UPI001CD1525A|nr:hypothetical protein [Paenibacillus vietnamensis]MCA0754871.1 hypothetical protein [Paenibacillus vietnamensis]